MKKLLLFYKPSNHQFSDIPFKTTVNFNYDIYFFFLINEYELTFNIYLYDKEFKFIH